MAATRRPDGPSLRVVPGEGLLPPERDADPRERVFPCGTDAALPGWRYRAIGGGFAGRLMVCKSSGRRPHRLDNPGSY